MGGQLSQMERIGVSSKVGITQSLGPSRPTANEWVFAKISAHPNGKIRGDIALNKREKTDCRRFFFVDGEAILKAMQAKHLTEVQLAKRANVAEQTVRNYIGSTEQNPWPAGSPQFQQVCQVLKLDHGKAQIEGAEHSTPHEDVGVCADLRFLGDPTTVRRIDGEWRAESVDVEIPGVVTYTNPVPWYAELTIKQYGNRFEARGIDKDDDGVFAVGALLEDGNWIRFEYWIDNLKLREYGTALAEYRGCGRVIEGLFMGRDHGHSSNGMVVAKLTLTRVEKTM